MSSDKITRRSLLKNGGVSFASVAASSMLPKLAMGQVALFPSKRPQPAGRKFHSAAVEAFIVETSGQIADPELAAIFANCFPNTLDTTVEVGEFEGKPDTAVITGDIPAMWFRDSSAQVWPYLPLASKDASLRRLLEGVIRRQARCLLIDPYANSFMADFSAPPLEWSVKDETEMKQGVGERKYELDSFVIRSVSPMDTGRPPTMALRLMHAGRKRCKLVLKTMRVEQRKDGLGTYRFNEAPAIQRTHL